MCFIKFDFEALRKRAVEVCPGANSIANYKKMEGGHNRAFIFTCEMQGV